jgi:hypothetical protein
VEASVPVVAAQRIFLVILWRLFCLFVVAGNEIVQKRLDTNEPAGTQAKTTEKEKKDRGAPKAV